MKLGRRRLVCAPKDNLANNCVSAEQKAGCKNNIGLPAAVDEAMGSLTNLIIDRLDLVIVKMNSKIRVRIEKSLHISLAVVHICV